MILVDTSIWIDHFRRGDRELVDVLSQGLVLTHPFVIGELACGNLRNRHWILDPFAALQSAEAADHEEVMHLVNRRRLWGKGVGWIYVHLPASALLSHCPLWTNDRSLQATARDLGIDA